MEIAYNGLPDLSDPQEFTLIPGVAILDEGPSDRFDFSIDDLERYIRATNKRIDEGDYILLTLGHTESDLPEWEQPEPVGYATNLRMGRLPNGRSAILSDYYVKTARYDEVLTYPRRSVELDEGSGVIDIVSFLRRAPERSMGLLTCKKLSDRSIYEYTNTGDVMTPEDIDLLAAKLASLLKMEKEDDKDEDKKEDLEAEADEVKDDEEKKEDLEAESDDEESDEKKEDLEASCPSGTNTFVPGEVDKDKARKMRSDSDRIKLSRLEKRLGEVETERDTLLLKLRRSERERDLKQLEAEGYQFDVVEELAHVEVLDDDAYGRHMDRARKLYRRFPVGGGMLRTATVEPKGGMGKDDIDKVVKLSAEKKISYAEALRQYKEAN